MNIDTNTKLYAVIGNPVHHSLSPVIHNAAFNYHNINAVYTAFEVSDIKNAVNGIRALGISGLSVTIPHKQTIMEYLDEIDDLAFKIGAVNTVINDNGKLIGSNSDGRGAYRAIVSGGINLQNKCIIIGSGGAARAIGFTIAFESNVKELVILGINKEEREKLAFDIIENSNIYVISGEISDIKTYTKNCELIINTTPVGMSPNINATPVKKEYLSSEMAVFDIVYNPYKTKLLQEALSIGCKIIHGTEMFLNQAIIQFELWTKKTAPYDVMKNILFTKLQVV